MIYFKLFSFYRCLVISILTLQIFLHASSAYSEGQNDKTLSPYFIVKSQTADSSERLPLKSTSASVKIAGTIADVVVTQSYKNEGASPIEALYVFPGSTRAAVYGMKMTIGDRVRTAEIKEKEEAKKTYEAAKVQGKSASLLEQKRPNVFQMSVANIMPGDEVKVELAYTEHLVPTEGIYEFVYPTVVGPRYSNKETSPTENKTSSVGENWVANPYLKAGEELPYHSTIKLVLEGGVPIQGLTSPSHEISSHFDSASRVQVETNDTKVGNRDFILRYALRGPAIQTGMLLAEVEGEKFFLFMAQPPQRLVADNIPRRDYTFVLDVSGSMIGFPLDVAKKLLANLFEGLHPTDTFNVVLFAGSTEVLSPTPLAATKENLANAFALIDKQNGGGGTELIPALRNAFSLPSPEGVARSIVVMTDGYVDVEKDALELIGSSLNKANLFMFGIGSSVNRYLIEALAHAGQGEPFVVTNEGEAIKAAKKFIKYISSPVLTNLKVNFDGLKTYDVEPKSLPDIFAERPVILFGKYTGDAKGIVRITGKNGSTSFLQTIDLDEIKPSSNNVALRYLWARKKLERLNDYTQIPMTESIVGEIKKIGLTYHLLTPYTSFVAVDSLVRNPTGASTSVKQPLPLPQGAPNTAVGNWGQIGTGPEPEVNILLATLLLLLSMTIIHPRIRESLYSKR